MQCTEEYVHQAIQLHRNLWILKYNLIFSSKIKKYYCNLLNDPCIFILITLSYLEYKGELFLNIAILFWTVACKKFKLKTFKSFVKNYVSKILSKSTPKASICLLFHVAQYKMYLLFNLPLYNFRDKFVRVLTASLFKSIPKTVDYLTIIRSILCTISFHMNHIHKSIP